MRLLVTGTGGFIGRRLAQALRAQGHDVLGVDRLPLNTSDREADVSEPEFWNTLGGGFDAVLHQAACTDTTVSDRALMFRHNLEAFQHLLTWAKRYGPAVVYASSAATYGAAPSPQCIGAHEQPLNVYGESKLAMDELTRAKIAAGGPLKIVGLRYFNVYGPGEEKKAHMASMVKRLALQMRAGKRPQIFRDGEQARDQVFVDDVVQANLLALAAPQTASGIYNVGTGSPTSFNRIVQELNAALGTRLEPEYIENPYAFFQAHTQADITTTTAQLGYRPAFDIHAGVTAYAAEDAL